MIIKNLDVWMPALRHLCVYKYWIYAYKNKICMQRGEIKTCEFFRFHLCVLSAGGFRDSLYIKYKIFKLCICRKVSVAHLIYKIFKNFSQFRKINFFKARILRMLGKFVDCFNYTCNDARRILRTLLTKYIYSYSDIVIILCFLFQFLRFQRSFFSWRINAWFFLLYILIIFFWLSLLAAYFRRLHLSDVILKKKEKQQKQQKDAMK